MPLCKLGLRHIQREIKFNTLNVPEGDGWSPLCERRVIVVTHAACLPATQISVTDSELKNIYVSASILLLNTADRGILKYSDKNAASLKTGRLTTRTTSS